MNNNRCMFIEGIGRVHVIGPLKPPPPPALPRRDARGRFRFPDEWEVGPAVALADSGSILEDPFPQRTWNLTMLAADIVAGRAEGKIRWSVRFQEKAL